MTARDRRARARIHTFASQQTRIPRRLLTVNVDGTVKSVPINDSSVWQETWLPGTVDIWLAHRKVQGGYQVEWELSTRAEVPFVGAFIVQVPGLVEKIIVVSRQWPAGRRLCGRLGVELDLWDHWTKPGGFAERHGPLEWPVPAVSDIEDQRTWSTTKLNELRAALNAHTTCQIEGFEDGIQAWDSAWPSWGNPSSIGPGGGSGIYFMDGWRNCVEYARLAAECSSTAMMRQWAFHNADGTHLSVDQYAAPSQPIVQIESPQKPPPFNVGADTLHNMLSTSHYIRIGRRLISTYEMTGSPMARRHLESLAQIGRLEFSERSGIYTLENGSGFTAANLASYENRSIAVGSDAQLSMLSDYVYWDRHIGWLMWFVAQAKKSGMAWTPGWQNWAERAIACMNRNQQPNGLIARARHPSLPSDRTIAPSMHEAIMGMGTIALSKQTGIAVPGFELNHAKALYRTDSLKQNYFSQIGPYHFIDVGTYGASPSNPVTTGFAEQSIPTEPGDPSHNEAYLAAMWFRSRDSRWLTDALEYGVTQASTAAKRAYMQALNNGSNIDDRQWVMPLLSAYQRAGL